MNELNEFHPSNAPSQITFQMGTGPWQPFSLDTFPAGIDYTQEFAQFYFPANTISPNAINITLKNMIYHILNNNSYKKKSIFLPFFDTIRSRVYQDSFKGKIYVAGTRRRRRRRSTKSRRH